MESGLNCGLTSGALGGQEGTSVDVVIFDWDDTLFPSSYVDPVRPWRVNLRGGAEALALLQEAAKKAQVVIISNGSPELYESLQYPGYEGVRHFLHQQQIPFISSRKHADKACRGKLDSSTWKRGCFGDLLKGLRVMGLEPTRVVSVGDSPYDMSALEANRPLIRGAAVTKVRLLRKPSEETLIQEHRELLWTWRKVLRDTRENLVMGTGETGVRVELQAYKQKYTDIYLQHDPDRRGCPPCAHPLQAL
ncbi:unnamed protein product [Vitrella brassicaformis CCMP3155]|uniref:Uncharacterized protein n=1 Tax=Vitrella brassicaformis (strain CCMP3155) TaxID=1169540 RepID=A0A0G4F0T2_VITBC|nr:unnamed protein product [Vitrella brassicaformis CCMP3155]|eukprot:CEM04677.1 unnamed protein product [Vitrella brassicaformis CCMP3155]